jgi:hypothetical protein
MEPQTALRGRQVHELARVCPQAYDEPLNLAVPYGKRCRRLDTNTCAKCTQFDFAGSACYTSVIRC